MVRKLSPDFIRIVSALAVILTHTTAASYFLLDKIGYRHWVITSSIGWLMIWAVPIFIMLSGYLLISSPRTSDTVLFYKKRLGKVLIPLIFWNIFYYIYDRGFTGSFTDFISQLFNYGTYYHLYFLNVLVGLYLLTPALSYFVKYLNLKIAVPLLIVLASVYHYSYSFLGQREIFGIFIFLPYLGYYLAGYWIRSWNAFSKIKTYHYLTLAAFLFSIFITRKLVFIFETHNQDTILVSRLSLLVAVFSVMLFHYLISLSDKFFVGFNKLSQFSNLTFGVYLVHPFWLEVSRNFPYYSYLRSNYYLFWYLFLFAAVTTLSFTTIYLIKKIPYFNRVV